MRQKSATHADGVGRFERGSFDEAMVQKAAQEMKASRSFADKDIRTTISERPYYT